MPIARIPNIASVSRSLNGHSTQKSIANAFGAGRPAEAADGATDGSSSTMLRMYSYMCSALAGAPVDVSVDQPEEPEDVPDDVKVEGPVGHLEVSVDAPEFAVETLAGAGRAPAGGSEMANADDSR